MGGERLAGAPRAREADLIHAFYERITDVGPEIVGVRLTAAAHVHGLALALPDAVMARPTGDKPANMYDRAAAYKAAHEPGAAYKSALLDG